DVSDGLLADLGHVCTASRVGAVVELEALPASPALARFRPEMRWPWQACGGDDYELCFTAPPEHREAIARALAGAGVPAARIGRTAARGRRRCRATATSRTLRPSCRSGFRRDQESTRAQVAAEAAPTGSRAAGRFPCSRGAAKRRDAISHARQRLVEHRPRHGEAPAHVARARPGAFA